MAPSFDACPIAESLSKRMCVVPVRAAGLEQEAGEIVDLVLYALDIALTASGAGWHADQTP